MARRPNNVGGRYSSAEPEAFTSDKAALEEGMRLLSELLLLRGRFGREPNHARAEELIRAYCTRLRRSDSVALAKVQRTEHLPDEWVVAMLVAVGNQMGIRYSASFGEGVALAFGCDLSAIRWFHLRVQDSRGAGRLFRPPDRGGLLPSLYLLNALTRWHLISDPELEDFRRSLAVWPTKFGKEDIEGEEQS